MPCATHPHGHPASDPASPNPARIGPGQALNARGSPGGPASATSSFESCLRTQRHILSRFVPQESRMLFSVRLVSRQPHDMSPEAWQTVVADQLRATKAQFDQGKIRAIYRETGVGVLAIYDVSDAREMDQLIASLPMARYFAETVVHPVWDMAPTLQGM
ncbi:MAG: hypothetical protein FIB00_15810 [Chloroflexi bacterium]|nr:hypothetical protein [Chloroflexota bacterium]PWB43223.1 MAG: hypothetical protein C3F10_11020 [Dehalococcoidia bacterium]